jgi:hypothetical protein
MVLVRSKIVEFAIAMAAVMALSVVQTYGQDTATEIKDGDECGVISADLFKSDFAGDYLVAGPTGCTLEGGSKTDCYCAPNLVDGTRLSSWTWQCGAGTVQFGPKEEKQCPAWSIDQIPKNGVGEPVSCNTTIHPGGRQGDEVCGYSDCTEGGSTSAICACIDPSSLGQGNETPRWQCLHSTCSCGSYTVKSLKSSAPYISTSMFVATVTSFAALAVSAFTM